MSNQNYKKYLQLENSDKSKHSQNCDLNIVLNEQKIKEDAVCDGLKGIIINNSELSDEELIAQYANLWQIEEFFRITKHDLRVRPAYHH